ncbi:hypothetical protein CP556_25005 [Natrinema sp. CBA1119]|nr:hypothetical protein CP556_25005 [Natrinema sp. CBA1119]
MISATHRHPAVGHEFVVFDRRGRDGLALARFHFDLAELVFGRRLPMDVVRPAAETDDRLAVLVLEIALAVRAGRGRAVLEDGDTAVGSKLVVFEHLRIVRRIPPFHRVLGDVVLFDVRLCDLVVAVDALD